MVKNLLWNLVQPQAVGRRRRRLSFNRGRQNQHAKRTCAHRPQYRTRFQSPPPIASSCYRLRGVHTPLSVKRIGLYFRFSKIKKAHRRFPPHEVPLQAQTNGARQLDPKWGQGRRGDLSRNYRESSSFNAKSFESFQEVENQLLSR